MYCTRDPVFGGACGIARFAAGGRRALLELPAATARASARPRGLSYAVAIRRNRQASLLEAETTKTAVSDFFGGAAAPGGLRLPPPSLRSWKTTKKAKQQSTTGRRRVGGILEVQGVTEVTPYARIEKLVAWRRRAAKNCRYPLFWVNKRPKKTQTTINR